MLAVLMWAAYKLNNGVFIVIYCVVVFAGQGAGWYVFWVLRRESWIALVAIGWYLAALITGLQHANAGLRAVHGNQHAGADGTPRLADDPAQPAAAA